MKIMSSESEKDRTTMALPTITTPLISEDKKKISGQDGQGNSTKGIDKEQLSMMGGFLRNRLEKDPLYIAKLFIRLLSKNFFKIITRLIAIVVLSYGISWVLITYTSIPKVYSSLILVTILILYYTRKQKNYATKYLVQFMLFITADRILTYHFNKPPGTLIILVIIFGLMYYTYTGIFKHVRTEAYEKTNDQKVTP
jgi:hypothetical protein